MRKQPCYERDYRGSGYGLIWFDESNRIVHIDYDEDNDLFLFEQKMRSERVGLRAKPVVLSCHEACCFEEGR